MATVQGHPSMQFGGLPASSPSPSSTPDQNQNNSPAQGSAEFLASKLKGIALNCGHFPKYRADPDTGTYPSVLGFFHESNSNGTFSVLETKKLCVPCLKLVVPEKFNFWSFAQAYPTKPGWLKQTVQNHSYPQAFLAGTEGFFPRPTQNLSSTNRSIAPLEAIFIPEVPNANEAWAWLQKERNAFYIDQLHVIKGWTLSRERSAEVDSKLVQRAGVPFVMTAPVQSMDHQSSPPKAPVAQIPPTVPKPADKPAHKVKKTSSKAKKTSSSNGLVGPDSNHHVDGASKLQDATPVAPPAPLSVQPTAKVRSASTSKIDHSEKKVSRSAVPSSVRSKSTVPETELAVSTDQKLANLIKSTVGPSDLAKTSNLESGSKYTSKKSTKNANNSLEASILVSAPSTSSTKVSGTKQPSLEPRKYTSNWGRHDPIPFDNPSQMPSLFDYSRRADSKNAIKSPRAMLPLEVLLKEDKSFTSDHSSNKQDILPTLNSNNSASKKGKIPVSKDSSQFLDSIFAASGRPSGGQPLMSGPAISKPPMRTDSGAVKQKDSKSKKSHKSSSDIPSSNKINSGAKSKSLGEKVSESSKKSDKATSGHASAPGNKEGGAKSKSTNSHSASGFSLSTRGGSSSGQKSSSRDSGFPFGGSKGKTPDKEKHHKRCSNSSSESEDNKKPRSRENKRLNGNKSSDSEPEKPSKPEKPSALDDATQPNPHQNDEASPAAPFTGSEIGEEGNTSVQQMGEDNAEPSSYPFYNNPGLISQAAGPNMVPASNQADYNSQVYPDTSLYNQGSEFSFSQNNANNYDPSSPQIYRANPEAFSNSQSEGGLDNAPGYNSDRMDNSSPDEELQQGGDSPSDNDDATSQIFGELDNAGHGWDDLDSDQDESSLEEEDAHGSDYDYGAAENSPYISNESGEEDEDANNTSKSDTGQASIDIQSSDNSDNDSEQEGEVCVDESSQCGSVSEHNDYVEHSDTGGVENDVSDDDETKEEEESDQEEYEQESGQEECEQESEQEECEQESEQEDGQEEYY